MMIKKALAGLVAFACALLMAAPVLAQGTFQQLGPVTQNNTIPVLVVSGGTGINASSLPGSYVFASPTGASGAASFRQLVGADIAYGGLPAAATLAGTEIAPAVQSGSNAQTTTGAIAALAIPANTILSKGLAAEVASAGSSAKTIILSNAQTLAANLTIPANVHLRMQQGGSITSGGYTLAINGGFDAPQTAQVFYGFSSGQVTIAPTSTSTCYAEWWGATTGGSPGSANDVPINSAMAACHDVTSLAGVYYTVAPIKITGNNIKWHGQGVDAAPRGTRISINSTTADCVDIGPTSYSRGTFSTYSYDQYINDITCFRVAPALPPSGSNAAFWAAGFSIKGTIRTNLTRTQAVDDVNGYYAIDTINLAYNLANANRADSSTSPSGDRFYGFYTDGVGSSCISGCPSLNASTMFNQDVVSAGGAISAVATGMYFPGSFSDQQLIQPNVASVLNGIVFSGPMAVGQPNSRTIVDTQIVNPIVDGIYQGGSAITINGTNPYGSISIVGGYGAFSSGATSGAMVKIHNARGVAIAGGFQFIGYPGGSGTTCLQISSSAQISVDGLWQDCYAPVVVGGSTSSGLNLTGSIYNSSQPLGLTAVSLAQTLNSRVNLSIDGAASGQFTQGVALDSLSTHNKIDVFSINTGVVVNPINDAGVIPVGDGYIGGTGNLGTGFGSMQSISGYGIATFTAGAAGGTGETVACAPGRACDSISGTVALTTGTRTSTGSLLTINLPITRATIPNCSVHINNVSDATYSATQSTSSIVFNVTTALTASTGYTLTYVCGGL